MLINLLILFLNNINLKIKLKDIVIKYFCYKIYIINLI